MDLEIQQFTRSDVVAVTGVDTEALKSWLKHGFIAVTPQQNNGPRGRRFFSVNDMFKIGVASELTQLNIPSPVANEIIASEKFSIWVDLSRGEVTDEEACRTVIVLYRRDGGWIADFLKGPVERSYADIASENVSSSVKAFVVIRLPEILANIEQNARALLMEEKPIDELSDKERAILAMRRLREKGQI